eukprot:TRINITY_DN51602_c0_g1_i1.p1 TRINITY_DN51602_c0_g1~~TRINITY_DN51602_c0_g1_i1.p1  ORF type:complete len:708 (+),score=91.94 TRINITY_DN51602_c0_g1_i1:53-2176(+)
MTSLEDCAKLIKERDYQGCCKAAEKLVKENDQNGRAWAYLGWSHFQEGRYELAKSSLYRAIRTETAWQPAESENMWNTAQGCKILLKMDRREKKSPGDELRDGWYATRLTELIDAGELSPSTDSSQNASAPSVIGPSQHVNAWSSAGERNVYSHWDGGERDINPGILEQYPCSQSTSGTFYSKDAILHFKCGRAERGCCVGNKGPCMSCRRSFPTPEFVFPTWNVDMAGDGGSNGGGGGAGLTVQPNPELDVFYVTDAIRPTMHESLRTYMDNLAKIRQDFPMPKYHNIIDPNVGSVDGLWVPTDIIAHSVNVVPLSWVRLLMLASKKLTGKFLPRQIVRSIILSAGQGSVSADCSMIGKIPDLDPHKHHRIYLALMEVFRAALPLLARLRCPALLLPGPLQVVVKAQRIFLGKQEKYAGVWHQDGLREHIIAVVLYYYRASPTLQGGDLEFVSKASSALWVGDGGGTKCTPESTRGLVEGLGKAKVPVREGTLVVFSNYESVHRVLPIIAEGEGSRDFVAFFVVDQRKPLPSPALGEIQLRKERRAALLEEQLQPRGCFGADSSQVYSTGNGAVADIGWVKGSGQSHSLGQYGDDKDDGLGMSVVESLNASPPLGRGVSFLIEGVERGWHWNPESPWVEHSVRGVGNAPDATHVYVNHLVHEFKITPPEEGVSDVLYFDDRDTWLIAVGDDLWTQDDEAWAVVLGG